MTMTNFVRKSLGLSRSHFLDLSPMTVRGSDRNFFRCFWGEENSAILIHYDPKRLENGYYGDICLFLDEIGIPVPRLIRHDRVHCLMLMEDMGNASLWSLKDTPWEQRGELYRKTLVVVQRLHAFAERDFPAGRVRLMENFNPDLYLWERNYFRDHFVKGFCGIELEPSLEQELEKELSGLAERLADTGRSLVHRDLQSQNVMVRDGEPFLIDFQGMRFGTPFYDLGSLLCDPYVSFSDDERDELLSFYYKLTDQQHDWTAFRTAFWEASAQRLMQALGAYGFLGLTKGLDTFLSHIPAGLKNLDLASSRASSLPLLNSLTRSCLDMIKCTGENHGSG